jgi:hypothetical protein
MGNNYHISAHSGAAVLQNCTNCTVFVINQQGNTLSPEERELVDLYRQLPIRARVELLRAAISLGEKERKGLN